MPSGKDFLTVGRGHIGERYENIRVPKNNSNWHGPWDCAEFASWVVFQVTGKLYGCAPGDRDPATAEAYTGYWWDDAHDKGKIVSLETGVGTVGAFLLRRPPSPGAMGHIAISDGAGHTVEARGHAYGVCSAPASGRGWEIAVLIPGVDFDVKDGVHKAPEFVLKIGNPSGRDARVTKVQERLTSLGFDAGPADGLYGPMTATAVTAYQRRFGVTADGEVGPITWQLLFS